MNLDVDYLIGFLNKKADLSSKEEVGEQESAPAAPAPSAPSSGGGGGSVPKWEDSYQTQRGKSNPLMKSGQKWETGLTRGAANKIW
jgi:hypothetical protein